MMKKVDKYVMQSVLQSVCLIFLCLLVLQIFILFVNQMGDIGKGQFTTAKALVFVLYRLPYELCNCFPIISLLGALVGLSTLANHSELVILRVNGLSILSIFRMVAMVGLGLTMFMMLMAECMVPHLLFKANTIKWEAIHEGHLLRQAQAVWFRNHENFWYINQLTTPYQLQSVTRFKKNNLGVLESIDFYQNVIWENGHWQFSQMEKTYFEQEQVRHQVMPQSADLDLPLKPSFFKHMEQNPDEMSLSNLWQRVHQLKNQQNIAKEESIFWQRLFQPLGTLMMMLLAIPCIFGPLRSSTMGAKLITGIALGFGFYILNQMFNFISQVYQIPPLLGATIPLLLFSLLGLGLASKTQ
jgi:lipopolysaccharide export system permease protein